MKSDKLFLTNHEKLFDTILKGTKSLFSKSGKKYMDMSGGFTSHAILGWGNKKIQNAMINQIKKYLTPITKAFYILLEKNYQKFYYLNVSRAFQKFI